MGTPTVGTLGFCGEKQYLFLHLITTSNFDDMSSELKAEEQHVELAYVDEDLNQEVVVKPDSDWKPWIVVAAASLNYGTSLMFLTASGFWLSYIEAEIGGAAIGIWLAQAWNPTNVLLAPAMSQMGDALGRRNLWLITLVIGFVGNALVATAKGMPQAIVGSIMFGIEFGNTGNIYAAAAEVLPRRHRGLVALLVQLYGYVAIFLILIVGARVISVPPGGISGWRVLFWLISASHVLIFALIFFVYHPSPAENPHKLSVLKRTFNFDLVGTVLYGLGLVPLMVGLLWGGVTYAWNSKQVVAALVVGCVFTLIFALHQAIIKKDGLYNHKIFKHRNVGLALFAALVEGMVYICFNDYYGQESAVLYGIDPYNRALRFSAFILSALVGTFLWMLLAYKYKIINYSLIAGFCLFLVGTVGLATATPGAGRATIAYAALAGFGFASPISCLFTVVQLCVDPIYIGQVSGLLVSIRSLGGCLGPSISGAIFNNKIATALPEKVAAAALAAGLPATSLPQFIISLAAGDAATLESIPGVTPQIIAVGAQAMKEAFAFAYRFIWVFVSVFVFMGTLAVILLKDVKPLMNKIVDHPLEPTHHKQHHVSHHDEVNPKNGSPA